MSVAEWVATVFMFVIVFGPVIAFGCWMHAHDNRGCAGCKDERLCLHHDTRGNKPTCYFSK